MRGRARARSAALAAATGAAPARDPRPKYVWQRLEAGGGDGDDESAERYETGRRDNAVALLAFPPRFALDVGCHSGGTALPLKEAYPGCRLWGIEPSAEAAERARRLMDKVIVGTFDTIDWSAQGVGTGEIDTVFLLDVLEHMYNPWRTLVVLRGLVSAQAQIVISLPNVRNMALIRDLMNGYWRYRDTGLLDSTHIRFFSQYEALRLIYQTGFRVERHLFTMAPETAPLYEERRKQPFPQRVEFEKGSLLIGDLAELQSFMAVQHLFLVRPAQPHELNAEEAVLVDGPHPETFALGSDRPGTL